MKRFVIALSALCAVWSVVRAGELSVGYSSVDITPPLGSSINGYYQDRVAKVVLDPLKIVCVSFSDGKETALLMQLDTLLLSDVVVAAMREAVSRATGVKKEGIFLHASHTHDSGNLMMKSLEDGRGSDCMGNKASALDLLYARFAISRAADAAVYALADQKPARLSCGRSEARRISFGRRYLMKDGKIRTNPGTNNPDIVRPVGSLPDEQVQVLRIDRDGGKPIAVINFQTHPDVVGGENITADWPGLTRTVFAAATGDEACAIVICGAQGDVNHCNVQPKPGELNGLMRDFDDVDRGYDHARHMANVLAAAVLSVWLKCEPLEAGPVRVAEERVRVPSQRAKDGDEKGLAWAERVWTAHKAGKDAELPWKGMELTTEVARALRILELKDGPDFFSLPLGGFAVGQSVAFCGFPGEPFTDIGRDVKKQSPFKLTLVSCLVNGSDGYYPVPASFKEGGYEAASSRFGESVGPDLVAGQLRLLKVLY